MSLSFPLLFRKFVPPWSSVSAISISPEGVQRTPITVTSALCVRPGMYRSSCGCQTLLLMDQWRYFPSCPRCRTRVDWIWEEPQQPAHTSPTATHTQSLQRSGALPGEYTVAGSAPTVLVVDDCAETRAALRGILERAGYDVEAASHGREGLVKLQEGIRPSVIVLNLRDEAAADFQRAQLHGPTAIAYIPVIVLSGVFGLHEASGEEPLTSPIEPETVLALVSLFCPAIGQRPAAEPTGVAHELGAEAP